MLKLGGSLTALTVMVVEDTLLVSQPPPAVPPLSLAVTVRVVVPKALAFVVNTSAPTEDDVEFHTTVGRESNSAELLTPTFQLSSWDDSLFPWETANAHASILTEPASSWTETLPEVRNDGQSLTAPAVLHSKSSAETARTVIDASRCGDESIV